MNPRIARAVLFEEIALLERLLASAEEDVKRQAAELEQLRAEVLRLRVQASVPPPAPRTESTTMGNFNIHLAGVGIHHNGRADDVEQMVAGFIDRLKAAGHSVSRAIVATGGEIDVLNRRSEILPIAVRPPASAEKTGGQVAYEAYCATTGNKSLVSGAELPGWADLKPEIRAAWEASARAVAQLPNA